MTFTFCKRDVQPEEAQQQLKESDLPQPIKDFVQSGIEAMQARYGDDVVLVISVTGHVPVAGSAVYEVTSCSVHVGRSRRPAADHPSQQFEQHLKSDTQVK